MATVMDVYTARERQLVGRKKEHKQNKHEWARGVEADDLLDQCM